MTNDQLLERGLANGSLAFDKDGVLWVMDGDMPTLAIHPDYLVDLWEMAGP